MECDYCGEEFGSREKELEHVLEEHREELTSHEKDEAKRELKELGQGGGAGFPLRKAGSIGIVILLLVAGGYGLVSTGIVQFSTEKGPTGKVTAQGIDVEGEPYIGNASAPVTMVIYEDFQCPYCKQFEQRIVPRVKNDYVEEGKVRIVWKDFAFLGPDSMTAATASQCVWKLTEDSSVYWDWHKAMFQHQDAENAGWGGKEDVLELTRNVEGVDAGEVRKCMDNQAVEDEVLEDRSNGRSNGVSGTPTVFINGIKVQSLSYSRYRSLIEQELSTS
ncbi:MAG: thioredoxin domain-containing protein [Candidatus Nanohaloarchaea archaeon]